MWTGVLLRGSPYGALKRVIDVAVASSLLVALSPIIGAAAVAVALSLGRPVLFRQERPGLHGKPFTLIKFRTMKSGEGTDAERLTRLGRFLRSTSIDELPELINIIRGEMSLVGPRPLLNEYLPLYSPRQATRNNVRPGLTGLAQVNGRNALAWDDRLELDAQYVEEQSLIIDLRIAGKTIVQVSQRSGISAEGEATVTRFAGTQAGRP